MKNTTRYIVSIIIVLITATSLSARTVDDLRIEDDKRTYLFFYDDKELGSLESVYRGEKSFKGPARARKGLSAAKKRRFCWPAVCAVQVRLPGISARFLLTGSRL